MRTAGPLHDAERSFRETVALIRKRIRTELPHVRASVRMRSYSSIRCEIKSGSEPLWTEDEDDGIGYTPYCITLVCRIKAICDEYNARYEDDCPDFYVNVEPAYPDSDAEAYRRRMRVVWDDRPSAGEWKQQGF